MSLQPHDLIEPPKEWCVWTCERCDGTGTMKLLSFDSIGGYAYRACTVCGGRGVTHRVPVRAMVNGAL